MRLLPFAICAAAALAACETPDPRPGVGFASAAGPARASPPLIPLEGRLPEPKAAEPIAQASAAVAEDGARLRQRGAALRVPVISAADQARFDAVRARAAAADPTDAQ